MFRRMGLMVGVALVMAGAGAAAAELPADTAEAQAGSSGSSGSTGSAAGDGAAEPELPHLVGPRRVDLGDGIELDLPAGMVLYERAQARAIFESWGDPTEGVIGLVSRPDRTWSVAIGYAPVGYVTDSDADKLDPDEMLAMYREGTTRQNAKRRARGVPELVIDGWSELPRYDHARHHLVWGLRTHNTEGQGINIFTNILGRGGYLVLGLIDDPSTIEQSKLEAAALIEATRFQPGSRYEDYREGDKTSGMGLRMLVLGGAGVAVAKAAKTGILAAILLVLKKGFVVIGAAIAGMLKWLTGRKSRPSAEPVAAGDPGAGAGAGPDVV